MELGDQTANRGSVWRSRGTSLGTRWRVTERHRRGEAALSRLLPPLAMVLVAATVLCGVLGYMLARQADDSLEESHRQALRGAVHALQAVSPGLTELDRRTVHLLESASGLKGLRLAEDAPHGAHAVQSLMDSNGRIVGWFTWEAERPASAVMARLLPFGGLLAVGLVGFALLATWQLRRMGKLLGQSAREVQRLANEDAITGLPNMHRMREEVDRALASRKSDQVVAVALIDIGEQRFIRRELPKAMATRSLAVHYQPIVRADGGAIAGVEALLRWNHPNRGYIPPGLFVPVAEEAGLMDQLGAFVLRRALADAARWPGLYVAVNLSPVQVRDRGFVDLVREVLTETKTDPARVVLEITEGVLINDPLTAKARLEDLRRIGVQLALDDFGSGYSSLAHLQQLPIDKLKIDRGFVAALDQSANTGVIIQAIVTLGRALGMSVLIEGIETEEQRVLLRLAGCNEMQGFLFAKPAAAEEVDRLLAAGGVLPLAASREAMKQAG